MKIGSAIIPIIHLSNFLKHSTKQRCKCSKEIGRGRYTQPTSSCDCRGEMLCVVGQQSIRLAGHRGEEHWNISLMSDQMPIGTYQRVCRMGNQFRFGQSYKTAISLNKFIGLGYGPAVCMKKYVLFEFVLDHFRQHQLADPGGTN